MSLLMRVATAVVRSRGVKAVLSSTQRMERDRSRHEGAQPAAPPGRVRRHLDIASSTLQGRTVLTARRRSVTGPRVIIVYLHGGGYINPMVREHWALVDELATMNDAEVLLPLYRLAPLGSVESELPFVESVVRRAAASGQPVVVAGDSAGGGLAAAVVASLRDQGIRVDHLVLFSPWLDIDLTSPEIAAVEPSDPSLAVPGLRYAGQLWAGDAPTDDWRTSPVHVDLRAFPPTTLVIGTHDIFLPDSRRFAERAVEADVDVELLEVAGGFHVFVAATFLPESRRVLAEVRRRLDPLGRST